MQNILSIIEELKNKYASDDNQEIFADLSNLQEVVQNTSFQHTDIKKFVLEKIDELKANVEQR